jgi:hypothetical protein
VPHSRADDLRVERGGHCVGKPTMIGRSQQPIGRMSVMREPHSNNRHIVDKALPKTPVERRRLADGAEKANAVPDQIDAQPREKEEHEDNPAAGNAPPEWDERFSRLVETSRLNGFAGLLLPHHVLDPLSRK